MEERLNGSLTMSKDMNPTRLVTMGIVAFAVISVLALGMNGGNSSTAADDAAASTPAPVAAAPAAAPQPAAPKAAPRSDEFNAWIDNPDEGAAESDDVADQADQAGEGAPPPTPPVAQSDNSNKNRPIGSDYE
jgi:hypothetical protein